MFVMTFGKVPMANFRRLLAIFWKTLLVASFGNSTWDIIVWKSLFVVAIFLETALMTTFESKSHLDVWLARLDLRERLLANLLERI